MEQDDIKEVIKVLEEAVKLEDWRLIDEALDFLTDFLDEEDEESSDDIG